MRVSYAIGHPGYAHRLNHLVREGANIPRQRMLRRTRCIAGELTGMCQCSALKAIALQAHATPGVEHRAQGIHGIVIAAMLRVDLRQVSRDAQQLLQRRRIVRHRRECFQSLVLTQFREWRIHGCGMNTALHTGELIAQPIMQNLRQRVLLHPLFCRGNAHLKELERREIQQHARHHPPHVAEGIAALVAHIGERIPGHARHGGNFRQRRRHGGNRRYDRRFHRFRRSDHRFHACRIRTLRLCHAFLELRPNSLLGFRPLLANGLQLRQCTLHHAGRFRESIRRFRGGRNRLLRHHLRGFPCLRHGFRLRRCRLLHLRRQRRNIRFFNAHLLKHSHAGDLIDGCPRRQQRHDGFLHPFQREGRIFRRVRHFRQRPRHLC